MPQQIVLATHNPHKVAEFARIVAATRPDHQRRVRRILESVGHCVEQRRVRRQLDERLLAGGHRGTYGVVGAHRVAQVGIPVFGEVGTRGDGLPGRRTDERHLGRIEGSCGQH